MLKASKASLLVGAVMLGLVVLPCYADPILAPGYSLDLFSLGTMPGTNGTVYGGLGFSGNNLLLAAYSLPAQTENIYSASVIRNASGQITGFGTVTSFSVNLTNDYTFGNAVAGGLTFLPNGTFLYTTATENYIGQFADGVSDLTPISDPNDPSAILGGLGYLPASGNSTQLVASFTNGDWFRVTATPNGLSPFYFIRIGGELISGLPANSFAYSPEVTASLGGGVLVGDVSKAALTLYGLDPNGNPLATTAVTLLNGNGEGIGYGVVVDPRTGNVILTGSRGDLWEILIPTPEPATVAGAGAALAVMLALYRRRRATGSKA